MTKDKKNKNKLISLKSVNKLLIRVFESFLISKTIFSIFLGNLLLYLLFQKQFEGVNIYTFLKLFIISILFLKTRYIMVLFEFPFKFIKVFKKIKNIQIVKLKNSKEFLDELIVEYRRLKKIRLIFHTLRSFIFNFLLYLFPITIIWILFMLYLIIRYSEISSLSGNFIAIITLFGIIISLFQFYLADLKNRKATNFKLISDDIKKELEDSIIVGEFKELMKKETSNLHKWYELTQPELVDNPKHSGIRQRIRTIEKMYPNMNDFFNYIEENMKLQGENKHYIHMDRKTITKELNKLYDLYFKKIEDKLYKKYEKEENLDEDLMLEYLLDSINTSNPEILSHYFEEDSKKRDNTKIYSFNERIQKIYLEALMNIIILSLKKPKPEEK